MSGDGSRDPSNRKNWRHRDIPVVRDKEGRPIFCMATVMALLENHEDWKSVLKFNEFSGKCEVHKAISGTDSSEPAQSRPLEDKDVTHAVIWFNRNGFPNASKAILIDALLAWASSNVTNPPREFLKSLRWDGIPRLSSWLQTYAGAEENDYVVEVGRRFFISLVARVLKPGCKSDECMVLEGGQGVGKSSLLRAIVGDEYFGDALPDIKTKEASIYIRGRWLVELSELSVLKRADFELVKSFMSRQEELYRPPYAKHTKPELRSNVFAGTTNRSDYLGDPTGSRRFLPIAVGAIDLSGIQVVREQLFAEAVVAFNLGEQWWVRNELIQAATIVQSERGEDDPWVAKVLEFCDDLETVSCTSILIKAIGMELGIIGNRETKRIAHILIANGWRRDGKFTFGPEKGRARYVCLKSFKSE